MTLHELLIKTSENIIGQQHIVILQGASDSSFFITTLLKEFARRQRVQCYSIDLAAMTRDDIEATLSMAFLGQSYWYILTNVSIAPVALASWFIAYLAQYQGPHLIWTCVQQSAIAGYTDASWLVVDLPTSVTSDIVQAWRTFMYPKLSSDRIALYQKLVMNNASMSLDELCILGNYMRILTGTHIPQFTKEWIPRLIAPERSLFILGSQFFARDTLACMQNWRAIYQEYSAQFWLSFWSDQLFRAYWYCYYQQQGDRVMAKKVAFRLPFSFLQKDWRKHSLEQLAQAQRACYQLDVRIKQGGSEEFIDFFIMKYLLAK